MKYKKAENFTHAQPDRFAVLITNLGTPDKADTPSLRRYLREFLSDPRVVEVPKLVWWCILNLVILVIRPSRSAKSYQSVWTEQGSPLAIYTEQQAVALERRLKAIHGDNIEVDWAMRYGNPSVESKLEKLQSAGARKLLVLPLYPQYSASTTASTFDAIAKDFTKRRWIPELRFKTSYCDHPAYISAIVNSIKKHWQNHGRADKLLFSYHGIPLRYLHNGDPYHCQCHKTTRLVVEALGIKGEEYTTVFQSRFGREQWLRPYTDETLKSLANNGVKSVQVICPGFSADCLETLEEIKEENKGYFMEAGGERFDYIPALNASEEHIDALLSIISDELEGWTLPASAKEIIERDNNYRRAEHNLPKKAG